jgi:ribose transport system substrate-binding protein
MRSNINYRRLLAASTMTATAMIVPSPAARADDAVAQAKLDEARYAGPQTKWEGPTSAPKPDAGKSIVFLSGDEQNDISHLYGTYLKETARSSDGK